MSQQIINTGTAALAGDGESIRGAFQKINSNFTELYESVSVDLTNVSSHILPETNLTYDLGSTSSQWRSLYVGTSTIYIGGTALSIIDGQLRVGGSSISATTSTLINGTYTFSLSSTGSVLLNNIPYDPANGITTSTLVNGTATVSLLIGGGEPYVLFPQAFGESIYIQGNEVVSANGNLALTSQGTVVINANVASTLTTWAFLTDGTIQFPDGSFQGTAARATTSTLVNGTNTVALSTSGNLILPGGGYVRGADYSVTIVGGNDGSSAYGDVNITTNNPFSTSTWSFGTTGELTLPSGGEITSNQITNEVFGTTTTSLTLVPGGATEAGQRLEIYATIGGEGNHLHLTAGELPTELYLGNDSQYVKLGSTGEIEISAQNGLTLWGEGVMSNAYLILPNNIDSSSTSVTIGNVNGDVLIQASQPGIPVPNNWFFSSSGTLEFPDGTTSTGATIFANSSSYKIQTISFGGSPSNVVSTYEFGVASITIPGNGIIYNEGQAGSWALDGVNGMFSFPNNSRISYGLNNAGLTEDDLKIQAINTGNVVISANGADWVFGTDGNLTFPSGSDVTFDNSATSYIYGVTGIEFADGTTMTTAVVGGGAASTVDITDTNGLTTIYYPTFVENRTTGQTVRADVDLTYRTDDNILGVGNIAINGTTNSTGTTTGALTVAGGVGIGGDLWARNIYSNGQQLTAGGGGVTSITAGTGTFINTSTGAVTIWTTATGGGGSTLEETFESKTSATSVVVHDCTTNRLFYHTNITNTFTANLTNLSLASGEATNVTLVLQQGATARMCNAIQIAGTSTGVTLSWQGSASAPFGNASRIDVISFSILCTATNSYQVLGMMTSFGGA